MNLQFEIVHNQLTSEQTQEIVKLWGSVLPHSEKLKRLEQVIAIAKNPSGEIVGVTTAYKGIVNSLRQLFYFYRIFIHPDYRSRVINRSGNNITTKTKEYLKNLQEDPKPVGMIAYLENRKVGDEIMKTLGWEPLTTNSGTNVWITKF